MIPNLSGSHMEPAVSCFVDLEAHLTTDGPTLLSLFLQSIHINLLLVESAASARRCSTISCLHAKSIARTERRALTDALLESLWSHVVLAFCR